MNSLENAGDLQHGSGSAQITMKISDMAPVDWTPPEPSWLLNISVRPDRPFQLSTARALWALNEPWAMLDYANIISDEHQATYTRFYKGEPIYGRRRRAVLLEKLRGYAVSTRNLFRRRVAAAAAACALCSVDHIRGSQEFLLRLSREKAPESPYEPYTDFKDIRPVFLPIRRLLDTLTFQPMKDPESIERALFDVLNANHKGKAVTRREGPKARREFDHDDAFERVWWHGKPFQLTRARAIAIEMLHDAHQRGQRDMTQQAILEEIETELEGRRPDSLRDLFKDHILWRLIQRTGNGLYRVNLKEKCSRCK